MRRLICTACGSNEMYEDGVYLICQYCGSKFLRETTKAASFEKDARIKDLMKRADLYWRHNKRQQAIALYRQILELDAKCAIARERLGRR